MRARERWQVVPSSYARDTRTCHAHHMHALTLVHMHTLHTSYMHPHAHVHTYTHALCVYASCVHLHHTHIACAHVSHTCITHVCTCIHCACTHAPTYVHPQTHMFTYVHVMHVCAHHHMLLYKRTCTSLHLNACAPVSCSWPHYLLIFFTLLTNV